MHNVLKNVFLSENDKKNMDLDVFFLNLNAFRKTN